MKRVLLVLLPLFFMGCLSANVTGYGFLETDPGVRIYKSEEQTYINITHKEGTPAPNYEEIAAILREIYP